MKKPFFWKARKCWFVKDDRRRNVRLHPDESIAKELWEKLFAAGEPRLDSAFPAPDPEEFIMSNGHATQAIEDLRRLMAKIEELATHQNELRRQIAAAEFEMAALRGTARAKMIALADREENDDGQVELTVHCGQSLCPSGTAKHSVDNECS